MLPRFAFTRNFSQTSRQLYKVSILGACGGIGQPLSLLMKLNNKVTNLSLYDLKNAKGVATDLSHIPTIAKVEGFTPEEPQGLHKALVGSDVVVIPAGVPRKPGMTRDDLFNINAGIILQLAKQIACSAPDAAVLVISNPVNSTVPIVAEVFKKRNVYNPDKLFGVTTLDTIRASTFLAELLEKDPNQVKIDIIGGHSGVTILPLLGEYHGQLTPEERKNVIHRVQFGGDEVVKAKNGAGSATLSMAYAGSHFANAVIDGLDGNKNVVEPAFVESSLYSNEDIPFFAQLVKLGPSGIEKRFELGELSEEEQKYLEECKEALKKNIKKGVDFVDSKHL